MKLNGPLDEPQTNGERAMQFRKAYYRWMTLGLIVLVSRLAVAAIWPIVGWPIFYLLDFVLIVTSVLLMPILLVFSVVASYRSGIRLVNGPVVGLMIVTLVPHTAWFTLTARACGRYGNRVRVQRLIGLTKLDHWADSVFATPGAKLHSLVTYHMHAGRIRTYVQLDPQWIPAEIRNIPTGFPIQALSFGLYTFADGDKMIMISILNSSSESSSVAVVQYPHSNAMSVYRRSTPELFTAQWNSRTYGVFQYGLVR